MKRKKEKTKGNKKWKGKGKKKPQHKIVKEKFMELNQTYELYILTYGIVCKCMCVCERER